MDQAYWYEKWDSQDLKFNQLQPNQLLQRYFPSLKLKPNACIFVPLCGKSIDMMWLVQQGFRVIGVELIPSACDAFFKENNLSCEISTTNEFIVYRSSQITLLAGDIFKLNKTILGKVDAVYDRAALIALPDSLREPYAQKIASLLDKDNIVFLITSDYNQSEMQGPPFAVGENEIQTLFNSYFDIQKIYQKTVREIPLHLRAKGLTQATELVHLLIKVPG